MGRQIVFWQFGKYEESFDTCFIQLFCRSGGDVAQQANMLAAPG